MDVLRTEFRKKYFRSLVDFLKVEREDKVIYPPCGEIYSAFNYCPLSQLKVVILGQDPYHGPDQAHGLAFSIVSHETFPPSLRNIFKELQSDLGCPMPEYGSLEKWARQGVFLLNSCLTVEQGKPASHSGMGWEIFTDAVIRTVSKEKNNVVFILWGKFAESKAVFLDTSKHYVLKSSHPSPLSAHRGFLGSKPFSKTNEYLVGQGIEPIDWYL